MLGLHIFVLVSWIAFWVYWFVMAARTKRSIYRGGSGFFGIRLGVIVIAVVLFRVDRLHSGFLAHHLTTNNVILESIGAIIVIAGLLFAVWARVHLGSNWGMPMSHKQDPEFITSGPYRYVRHPIYTGIIFASLGTALAVGPLWLILFIVFGAYFIFSAFQEEKYLAQQFGTSYTEYKKRSKMLIPFVF